MAKQHFDCLKCTAYCCSYPRIEVKASDIKRLAKHFEISPAEAKKRFTKKGEEKNEQILRHQEDEHYGSVCRFLDTETRNCTIHQVRPKICRDYPGTKRCGYYEFLKHERMVTDDPDYVAVTYNF